MLLDFTTVTHWGAGAAEQEEVSVHENSTAEEAAVNCADIMRNAAKKLNNPNVSHVDFSVRITVDGESSVSDQIRMTSRIEGENFVAALNLLGKVWVKFQETHL